MAVASDLHWLAQGVELLGGTWSPVAPPDLVQVDLPPDGWAQLEGRVFSPFFPPPPTPPRLWALTEAAWRSHPDAEWLLPGSGRLRQWANLAESKAPALVARWASDEAATLSPVLTLLWRVESNGSGSLAWTLATTTPWPQGPARVAPAAEVPPWAEWIRSGALEPARETTLPSGFRQAFDVTLQALARWLAPRVAGWARDQRQRWEAERAQVEAYYRAVALEKSDPELEAQLQRHVRELERNLAPRLRARPLLALLLYLPPEARERLLEEGPIQGTSGSTSSSASAPHSGQARGRDPARWTNGWSHPGQMGRSHAPHQAGAHPSQKTVPQVQDPAQAGQSNRGHWQSLNSPSSRPHS